jgi:hypothetical protein
MVTPQGLGHQTIYVNNRVLVYVLTLIYKCRMLGGRGEKLDVK